MQRFLQDEKLGTLFELTVLDISDRRDPKNIGNFDIVNAWLGVKHISQCFIALLLRRPGIVYLNLSQSPWGYLRDLGFMIPAALMRRKIVVHLRGSEFRSLYKTMPRVLRALTQAVFKRVSRVIVLGHSLKHIFAGLVADDRIVVIPNGIDCRQFDSSEAAGIPRRGANILYLSSLRRRKGILKVLEALPNIVSRHPEVHMTFAGDWQDDKDRRQALALIEDNRLGKYVTFTGEINGLNKMQLYKQHDVFVFPPIEPEGLPWVVLEAMSAGLPVVTSDQGAIGEVVQDGKTGYLIDPEPTQISDKVCYLLENRGEAKSMGLNGRRRVEQDFSEVAYLNAIRQVFRDALEN
jgi:glycosyltransferase involved in cell wall biosynthesis